MKRIFSILAAAALLLSLPAAADPQSTRDYLSLYSGLIGQVAFALPGAPQVARDADYQGYWTNSVQLFGHTAGGEEFQLRSGDIAEWIDGELNHNPSLGTFEAKSNALLGYAGFFIHVFGGQLDNLKAGQDGDLVYASFTYTYPDTPGVPYRCRAILQGSTAVCLMGEDCAALDEAMDLLRSVTEEEREALARPEAETVTLGILSANFPGKAYVRESEEWTYAAHFSREFSFLAVQHLRVSVELDEQGAALEEALKGLVKTHMLPSISGEGVYNARLSSPSEDTALLEFSTVTPVPLGEEHGQHWLCRLYIGTHGVWYVWVAETENGKAFLDTLVLSWEEGVGI